MRFNAPFVLAILPFTAIADDIYGPPGGPDGPPGRNRCDGIPVTTTIKLGPFASVTPEERDNMCGPDSGGRPGCGDGWRGRGGFCQPGNRPMEVGGQWGCCACGAECTREWQDGRWTVPGAATTTVYASGRGPTVTQTIWANTNGGWGATMGPINFAQTTTKTVWGGSSSPEPSWTKTVTSVGVSFGRSGTWTMFLNPSTTRTGSETFQLVQQQTRNAAPTAMAGQAVGVVAAGLAAVGALVV